MSETEIELGQALKRAIERNNELEAELAEQARLVGMGSEREARLETENDQLRHAMDGLTQRCVDDTALIGELVEALNQCGEAITWQLSGEPLDTMLIAARDAARTALAKVGVSK